MKHFSLKLFIALTCIFLCSGSVLYAQRTISGKVTDAETGEGLIGASIIVKGTTIGALTSADGSFTINRVPQDASTLKVSYTGYADQELTIGASNTYDVKLAAGTALEEVVVIGYGTVKKQDVTGSVVAISAKSFNKGAIVAPQELIAGKIAGVQVTPSADAGGGGTIRVRGGSSLSASNDPLIVIDGVPVDNTNVAGSRNNLNIVNPNDIETFTVLKDASATAIYGSRASNGVIIITTKKGALGSKMRVDYSGLVSFSNKTNQIDVLNAGEFRSLIEQRYPEGSAQRALLGNANTDWQSEIYQTGISQDHNLGISGAVGKFPYRIAGGFTSRTGILKTDNLDRLTGSINLSPKFFNNTLQVNAGIKLVRDNNFFANRGAIGAAVAFDPTQSVRAEGNDAYGGYYTWKQPNGNPITIATANPVALLEQQTDKGTANRYIATASFDYRFWFLKDLRANLNLAHDRSTSEGDVKQLANAAFAFTNKGLNRHYEQQKENSLLEFYLNYTKKININHKFDIMGGYSWQRFYINDLNQSENADGSIVLQEPLSTPRENFLVSLFGRLNYSFQDRYLLTVTARRDASSRFGPDYRAGFFPSAALGWKIVENQDADLSNLKLRLGVGETGQQDIGNTSAQYYAYQSVYQQSQNTAQYQFGNEFINTLRPAGYDAKIKWETTTTYNLAVDYGFFKNRVYGTVELYKRDTRDLLNFIPVAAGTNLTNFITTNVGDLTNQGVEFSLNVVAMKSETATWEIGGNVTYNHNEITKLTATDDPTYQGVFTGGIAGGVGNTIQVHSVGYSTNAFFVYEQVYDDQGVPIEGLYVDRNGDGQVTPTDRYRYKSPNAPVFFGFYSSYNRGNWDFSFAGRANVGNYMYNNVLSANGNYNNLYNSAGYLGNVHGETSAVDFKVPQYFSDHYVQNASFLRLDHITLGYTVNKVRMLRNLRVYATVQNPITVTQYNGLDPEVFGGIDNNLYPRSRTFVFGLNASF